MSWAARLGGVVWALLCAAMWAAGQSPMAPSEVLGQGWMGIGLQGRARVVSLEGSVSVLKDGYPWALRVGDTVDVGQMIVSGPDGLAVLRLEDGSAFYVFPNSRVTFRSNRGSLGDLLDLWIGRVKFYIRRLGGQPAYHRVFTPTAVISVRGTVFEVAVEDEDDTTLVAVEEGVVEVRHRLIGESKPRLVRAGEYLRVYKNVPLARSRTGGWTWIQRASRVAADVVYGILLHSQHGGAARTPEVGLPPSPSPGGGVALPGDTPAPAPPPPPSDMPNVGNLLPGN